MKIVFALLIAAGVLGLGLALVLMSGDNRGKIERRLGDLLQEPREVTDEDEDEFVPKGDQALAETALMQRMVGITGRLADRAGLLARTEDALEQADLPLRPPEALFFYFAGLFVVGMLGLLVLPIPMALGLALVAGLGPVIVLHRRRGKRLRDFQTQLPGTLNLLSGSMRAGFSFAQGLESVANEATAAHAPRAAAGVHRVAARPSDRGRARGLGAAHDERRPDVGGHGHPHPARGRWKPGRAARHGGRHDDPAGAVAPRDQGADGGRTLLRVDPRVCSRSCSQGSCT